LQTKANNKSIYLQNPEAGKRLHLSSVEEIQRLAKNPAYDIVIAIADGLSATAIHQQIKPVLDCLVPLLQKATVFHCSHLFGTARPCSHWR